MAGSAIEQLGAFDRIAFGPGFVTVDAPAHVDGLFNCFHSLFAHIAVAVLAVQPGRDVWAVIEMHKIRHLVDRDPINRFVLLYIRAEFLQLDRPLCDWHRRLEIFL